MEGVWRWRTREIIYLPLHCHHQNDSCIRMGSSQPATSCNSFKQAVLKPRPSVDQTRSEAFEKPRVSNRFGRRPHTRLHILCLRSIDSRMERELKGGAGRGGMGAGGGEEIRSEVVTKTTARTTLIMDRPAYFVISIRPTPTSYVTGQ